MELPSAIITIGTIRSEEKTLVTGRLGMPWVKPPRHAQDPLLGE